MNNIDITDVLEAAAAAVRKETAARLIANIVDEEDFRENWIETGVLFSALDRLQLFVYDFDKLNDPESIEKIDTEIFDGTDALPVLLVAPILSDVIGDDLVCVEMSSRSAVIALVTPDGKCRRSSIEVMPAEQMKSYLDQMDANIFLTHARFKGVGIMVFAGMAAHQLAGGLGVIRSSSAQSKGIHNF